VRLLAPLKQDMQPPTIRCALLALIIGSFASTQLRAQYVYQAVEVSSGTAMLHVVRHGTTILGIDTNGDTHEWDGDSLTWTAVTGAGSLSSFLGTGSFFPAFASRGSGSTAVGWNGYSLVEFNGTSWSSPTATNTPNAELNFSLVGLPNGDTLLFGGVRITSPGIGYKNETWKLSSTNVWSQVTTANSPGVRGLACIAAASSTSVLMFGGTSNGATLLNDTWHFNGTNWSQVTVSGSPPSARVLAGLAWRPDTSRYMMIGGYDTSAPFTECWTFDGSAWASGGASYSPVLSAMFSAVFDENTNEVVTVDAGDGNVILGQLYGSVSYGNGCVCDGQSVSFALGVSGAPLQSSTTFDLTFANFHTGNFVFVAMGSSPAPTPTQITGLPAGCVSNLSAVDDSFLVTTFPHPFDIPDTTAVIGLRVVLQAVQLNFSPFNGCSSDAQDIRIGRS
jgi:hypothetical protein